MTTTLVNHSKNAADIVAHAVTTTRAAAPAWAAAKRQPHLLSWKRLIHSRSDELIDLVCAETGKSHADATVEVTLALEHLDWAARNASRVMSEQRVHRRLLAFNQSAVIRRQPFGVVGVIGPWNYPVFTPMGSISYALAAGNAVVFKPSEYTPRTGQWLAQTFAEAVPQHQVFEFVIGDGRTGQRLCEAEIDKLAFSLGSASGRRRQQGMGATRSSQHPESLCRIWVRRRNQRAFGGGTENRRHADRRGLRCHRLEEALLSGVIDGYSVSLDLAE